MLGHKWYNQEWQIIVQEGKEEEIKLLGRDHLINAGVDSGMYSQEVMGKAGKKYTAAFRKDPWDGYTTNRVCKHALHCQLKGELTALCSTFSAFTT